MENENRELPEILENDADTREEDLYDGNMLPFPLPDEIDIREDHLTIFELNRKMQSKNIILNPEFQRNLVWKSEQKCRFIESIIMGIPLPPFYVYHDLSGKYIMVDGLQRSSTIASFLNDGFALEELQVLPNLNGLKFSELKTLQTRLEDKNLLVYVIKPSVPGEVLYDIFNRINTGGTQLTRQEIRNCIFIGNSTALLKKLSEKSVFRKAIDGGISPTRMKDREAVLRYLAFTLLPYETDYNNDMDEFLGRAMRLINQLSSAEISVIEDKFDKVMTHAYRVFGTSSFRIPTDYSRGRVNIALFEVISYFFYKNEAKEGEYEAEQFKENLHKLFQDIKFIDAIRFSTGDKNRVLRRFSMIERLGVKNVN